MIKKLEIKANLILTYDDLDIGVEEPEAKVIVALIVEQYINSLPRILNKKDSPIRVGFEKGVAVRMHIMGEGKIPI